MNSTASPGTITLKGKEFKVYPLSDFAIGELVIWVRSDFIRSVRIAGASRSEMDQAFEFSRTIDWADKSAPSLLSCRRGVVKLFQVSVKCELSSVEVYELFSTIVDEKEVPNLEKINEFADVFTLVNDLVDSKDNKKPSAQEPMDFMRQRAIRYERMFREYQLTPDLLAKLTPAQQAILDNRLSGIQEFSTQEEFEEWEKNRGR